MSRSSRTSTVLSVLTVVLVWLGTAAATAGKVSDGHLCSDGSVVFGSSTCPVPPPSITAVGSVPDGSGGTAPYQSGSWTNQAVTVHFSCLNVTTCPGDQVVTESTSGVLATVQNGSGTAQVLFGPVNIDTTAPTAAFTDCPAAGVGVGSQVSPTWLATDSGGSGLATAGRGVAPLDTQAPATGAVVGTPPPVDLAGNVGTAPTCTYDVVPLPPTDTTAPTVSWTLDPGVPGDEGWYNTPVTLTWHVSEPDSATFTTSGCQDVTIQADQPKTPETCQATSSGGTSPTVTVTVGYDSIAPSVSAPVFASGRTVLAVGDPDVGVLASATDPVGTAPDVTYTVPVECIGPDTHAVGTGSVQCTAHDRAYNTTTSSLTYSVTNAFRGFTAPAPGATFKGGSRTAVGFTVARSWSGEVQIGNAATRVSIGGSTAGCAFSLKTAQYQCTVTLPRTKGSYPVVVSQNVGTSANPSWVRMVDATLVGANANGETITVK